VSTYTLMSFQLSPLLAQSFGTFLFIDGKTSMEVHLA
jgi:hypothetical protein